ncbi:MAG TPA: carboxypeptidase-like regulatory domain-containing protein [Vicinamibacterales bacterium]|nr:carboxypeptidase-like regulatory domain-containing protein [Vicinamibacterales bacterium]
MTPRTVALALAVLIASAGLAAAQDDRARVTGVVTDRSGGALPGVTVTLRGAAIGGGNVVTDGAGRYVTSWVIPGTYAISFELSGFESRMIQNLRLTAGQTVILDQEMSLAALSETVQVVAPAPVPPPPPKPKPRPALRPVDPGALASVCGPREAPDFSLAVGRVVSHRDDPGRQLLGPGDAIRIEVGEDAGIIVGQNLVVRRRFRSGDRMSARAETYGEQRSGLIQVIELEKKTAVAVVVYSCGEMIAGDAVERYVPQLARMDEKPGTPQFDDPAKVVIGDSGQQMSAAGQMMVIDRGVVQGAQRGQRVTMFRRVQGNPPLVIGEGVIIALRPDSATIRIERATDAIMVGDLVALHR